ncbi:hypothetical protein V8C37DRAFT_111536 [Trichoderma ceciliae]
MHQQSMLNPTDVVTVPNAGKKRGFRPEQAALDAGVDCKKRRYENHGNVAESSSDSTDLTTTKPSSIASDVQSCLQLSGDGLHRGRTRWRAGSEPPGWDYLTWYMDQSMAAGREDSPLEQRNQHHGSEIATEIDLHNSPTALSPDGCDGRAGV